MKFLKRKLSFFLLKKNKIDWSIPNEKYDVIRTIVPRIFWNKPKSSVEKNLTINIGINNLIPKPKILPMIKVDVIFNLENLNGGII